MTAVRKVKTGAELVADAARKALNGASGDLRQAALALEAKVRNNASLRAALTEPLIAGACYDAVRVQVKDARAVSWKGREPVVAAHPAAADQSTRVVALARGTLLMFPLPTGGKKLGEATRAEIAEAAEFYEKQATDMGQKSRWLRLVAQSIPTNQKAGEVLTEKRLRELQKAARDE